MESAERQQLSGFMVNGRLLLLGGAGVGALLLFGALFAYLASASTISNPDRQLDWAMELLDEGRWDLADRIARDIESADQLTPARQPIWNYVRGVAGTLSTSDKLDSPKYRRMLRDATELLEASREAGFPLGYRGPGAFYLGYGYFNTYAWDDALEVLPEAVQGWPERRSDALEMMVAACLRSQPPKRERAEELLQQWSKIPGLAASEKNRITLAHAQLAFLDGQYPQCDQILSTIPADSQEYAAALLGRGRWKFEAAKKLRLNDPERKDLFTRALKEFRYVMLAANTPSDIRRQSTLLTGLTLRYLDRNTEAVSTLGGVRQRNPQSAEAIAAGIDEAEIQLNRGDWEDALDTAQHIITNLGDVRLYDERWIPLNDLRRRLLQIGRQLRDQGEFNGSVRLASYLSPTFPKSDAVRLEAETFENWGSKLEAEPSVGTAQTREQWRRQVDAKYTLAGDKYRDLARLELRSAEYTSLLWRAIECYRKSGHLDAANVLLNDYLKFEERAKRPRGLLALGQNHLNAGRWDDVLPPLERCLIENPDHPLVYNVRLVMARALTEKQQLEKATEVLMTNLYDGNLRPDSQLFRDSLFELGNVIYRRGDQLLLEGEMSTDAEAEKKLAKLQSSHEDFSAATKRLAEAITRYDRDKRSLEARYSLGRAYRAAARFPQQVLASGQITIDAMRRRLALEQRQLLESALSAFRNLRQALDESQEVAETPKNGQSLLRNCFFGEADVLFELERFDEAIAAYRNVGNRFMNEPEALEALVQIAECFRALGQEEQARRTLLQAEQMLSRIPAEADARFTTVTRADRASWQQLLAWLKQAPASL